MAQTTPAQRWGRALIAEMERKGMRTVDLARACGWEKETISRYRNGGVLPLVARATVMAEVLDAPRLLELCVQLRTVTCEECERTFVDDRRGTQRRWCGHECHDRYVKRVIYASNRHWTGTRYDTWKRLALRRQAAIDAMCRACEPEGICRQVECELRAVSPLPLARRAVA